jgi:transcription-repair coupling factor (superfamily II helicase)
MDSQDRAALNDLLRMLDGPAGALAEGGRLRWTSPTGLAMLLARWATENGRIRTLWVDTPTEADAQTLAHELAVLLPEATVANFPGFAPFAGGESSPPGMVLKDRLATLIGLLEHRVQVLVTGPLAAVEKLPHPAWFDNRSSNCEKARRSQGISCWRPWWPWAIAARIWRAAPGNSAPEAWSWIFGRITWRIRCA